MSILDWITKKTLKWKGKKEILLLKKSKVNVIKKKKAIKNPPDGIISDQIVRICWLFFTKQRILEEKCTENKHDYNIGLSHG